MLSDIAIWDTNPSVKGIYAVLNRIAPSILTLRPDQINRIAKGKATSEENVLRRRWLVLDFDPVKETTEANSSSTDAEKAEAFSRAQRCEEYLTSLGFPEPIRGDSGNGAHRIYRIDMPNDDKSYDLIAAFLEKLTKEFNIDVTMKDAPRISKVYGTIARKGANTPERPHRRSCLVSIPKTIGIVTEDMMRLVIAKPDPTGKTGPVIKGPVTVKEGVITMRHPEIKRQVTSMVARKNAPAVIHAAIAAMNKTQFSPPKGEQELKDEVDELIKWALEQEAKKEAALKMGKMRLCAHHDTGEYTKVVQSLDALVHVYNYPSPRMFVREGKLCRIIYNEKGIPRIDELDEKGISVALTECVDWWKTVVVKEKGKDDTTVEVVTVTPQQLIPRLSAMGQWPGIPALRGIVESPYITEEGEIIARPGYNPQTELYLALQPDFKPISVPDFPDDKEVFAAKKKLFDLFEEFTFEDESSRQNHIGSLITSAIRPIINGVVPLFVYDKPVMGAGASLLADIISRITTGRPASMTQAPDKNTSGEWNKLIIGLLREGRSLNIFDNVEGDFYSASLASLLTTTTYKGRILGKNATEEYPNNATWIANGNNMQITHDLPRRCVWVRLATDTARPFERTDWKIPDIRRYSMENQSELLSAILTIARAWFVAKKPKPAKTMQIMGGYEEWRDIVGGIMQFIKCDQFLVNTAVNLDIAEEQHEDIEIFLEEVFIAFPDKKGPREDGKEYTLLFPVKDITPILDDKNYVEGNKGVRVSKMPAYLQEMQSEHPRKVSQAIGHLFKKNLGRVTPTGYKLLRGPLKEKSATYQISFKRVVRK